MVNTWQKILLSLGADPKTDSELAYVYRNMARPEIPASALWDAEKGAMLRRSSTNPEQFSLSDLRRMAIANRGWGVDQTAADMPETTPTGRIMKQLLAPDVLVVPDKRDMTNLWGK